MNRRVDSPPLGIYYEHPYWFERLFEELDRRRLDWVRLNAQTMEPEDLRSACTCGVVLNRMGALPSCSEAGRTVQRTLEFLRTLEANGVQVINGLRCYQTAVSKIEQERLVRKLGLNWPRSRRVESPDQLASASQGMNFPLLLKPNVGGSGSDIRFIPDQAALREAQDECALSLGVDGLAQLQEYHLPAEGSVTRIEILDDTFLYSLAVPATTDSFNYCPADGCGVEAGKLTATNPPDEAVDEARRILRACRADLGGVEYLVSTRDGRRYYFDVNPLSNYVARPRRTVGFDPTARLVDYLEEQLCSHCADD